MSERSVQPEEELYEMIRRMGSDVIRSAFQSFLDKNKNIESFSGQDHLFNGLEPEIRRGLLRIVDAYNTALRETDIPRWSIRSHIDEMRINMIAAAKEASDAIKENVFSRTKDAEEEAVRIFESSLFD